MQRKREEKRRYLADIIFKVASIFRFTYNLLGSFPVSRAHGNLAFSTKSLRTEKGFDEGLALATVRPKERLRL